jgi:hypothetical protein
MMEFRIFLPLFLSNDEWLSTEMREEYETHCHQMKDYFMAEKDDIRPEERCDSYYIGGDYVGVKLRVTIRRL